MLTIREYKKAESLQEAYELNQKKTSRILGGGVWLRMGDRRIGTVIDLSGLRLDQITEDVDEFVIGCMVTLRDLEMHKGLAEYTSGAIKESVRHIVGVQFRNCATVGGSIYGRFGFSDILTIFLAMDTEVELYHVGRVALSEFIHMPYDNDILVALHVKKTPLSICYLSQRNTATDFPVVACAVSEYGNKTHISIGARPARAEVVTTALFPADEEERRRAVDGVLSKFTFGTNRRAGADYRRHIAGVLIERAYLKIL